MRWNLGKGFLLKYFLLVEAEKLAFLRPLFGIHEKIVNMYRIIRKTNSLSK